MQELDGNIKEIPKDQAEIRNGLTDRQLKRAPAGDPERRVHWQQQPTERT